MKTYHSFDIKMEEAYLQVVCWAGHHLVALEAYPGVARVARGGIWRRGGGADITNYYDVKAKAIAKSTDH